MALAMQFLMAGPQGAQLEKELIVIASRRPAFSKAAGYAPPGRSLHPAFTLARILDIVSNRILARRMSVYGVHSCRRQPTDSITAANLLNKS